MSRWNHVECEACWARHEPDRIPVRVGSLTPEPCCTCGQPTTAGIYVRFDPEACLTRGDHPEAAA